MSDDIVAQFKQAVSHASYHHADDSCREWDEARVWEDKARALFREADDDLKARLREIARGNLIGDWWRA